MTGELKSSQLASVALETFYEEHNEFVATRMPSEVALCLEAIFKDTVNSPAVLLLLLYHSHTNTQTHKHTVPQFV